MCAPGTFAATRRAPACAACPTGTYANSWGSTHCAHCIIGTHAPHAVRARASPARASPAPPRKLAGARPAPRARPRAPSCCLARGAQCRPPACSRWRSSSQTPVRGSLQCATRTRGACARAVRRWGECATPKCPTAGLDARAYALRVYIPYPNPMYKSMLGARGQGARLCLMCPENATNAEDGSDACAVPVRPGTNLTTRYAVIVSFGVFLNGTSLADIAPKARPRPRWGARRSCCLRPTAVRRCEACRRGRRPRASAIPSRG
jgi:hypothetical protein